ncbi:MAG: methyltransferase [Actinomyces sp.]|nr:methyltransferase [Actinomyces sp.]
MWFRGLTLAARPGVFVVRPETEVVAGEAIAAARAVTGHPPLVVDLCTGSGAIALAVADEVPTARVVAVELDPQAVALAQENIATLAPRSVDLVAGDATTALTHLEGRVDVVVSNPLRALRGDAHPGGGAGGPRDGAVRRWRGRPGGTPRDRHPGRRPAAPRRDPGGRARGVPVLPDARRRPGGRTARCTHPARPLGTRADAVGTGARPGGARCV